MLNNFGCSAAFVYPSEFALSFSWYWSILYSAEFTCYTFLFDFIYIYRGQDIVIPYSLHKLCCHSSYLLPPSSMVQASSQDTTVPPLDRKLTTLAELWQGHPGPLPPSPRFFFFWIPLVKWAKSLQKPVQTCFACPPSPFTHQDYGLSSATGELSLSGFGLTEPPIYRTQSRLAQHRNSRYMYQNSGHSQIFVHVVGIEHGTSRSHTSRKTPTSPGWLGPFVLVLEQGLKGRY